MCDRGRGGSEGKPGSASDRLGSALDAVRCVNNRNVRSGTVARGAPFPVYEYTINAAHLLPQSIAAFQALESHAAGLAEQFRLAGTTG